ncbi:DUF6044 family protein [bacterium]|nr:DUF6044 family protein [bacterium]
MSWASLPIPALVLVAWKFRKGCESIVEQHDVLDGVAPVFNRLELSDLFAAPGATIPYLLGGLDRGFVGSEFHIGHLTFVLLPLLWAFIVNELLARTLAHVGMYLFLGRLGLSDDTATRWGGATIFSLLPFYPMGFGAAAMIPLLLFAFVMTVQEQNLTRAAATIFACTPLYIAAYATIPYWIALAAAGIGIVIVHQPGTFKPLLRGLLVFGVAIVVIDWRMFLISAIGPTSHRSDMVTSRPWSSVFDRIGQSVLAESPHAYAGRSMAIAVVLVVGLAILLAAPTSIGPRLRHGAAFCLGLMLFATVGSRVWPWLEGAVLAEIFTDWGRFQMSRLRWMEPALITSLAALSIGAARRAASGSISLVWTSGRVLITTRRIALGFAVVVASLQVVTVVNAHTFRRHPASLTLAQYFAPSTMGEVRAAFEADSGERAVSIRLHPSVAIQNGIPAADGYWSAYDIEYKYAFRNLIAPTLDAHPSDASYYDRWGSRVYVFLGEQGRTRCCAEPYHSPIVLRIDPVAMRDLDVTHVISGSEILNAGEVALELVGDFGRPDELGQVLLYRRTDG